MKNYELLEHTADIRIRVKGKDPKELFANAALAVFDIIAERTSPATAPITAKITQEADNLEELFINWLNELLSLSFAKGIIFTAFKIKKLTDKKLTAEALGEPVADFKVNTEVKAATYHELKLSCLESGCLAEVVFDV